MKRLNKITIIGVGLIGGSMGLAIKAKGLARKVVGVGHRKSSIDRAVRLRTVDEGTLNLAKGVEDADIVVLATPILSMVKLVKKIAPHLKRGCIVTDVGSTKRRITQEMDKLVPKGVNFIGGHPMAGSEKRGVDQARRGLFKDSICILTKTKVTKESSLRAIKDLWLALGAKIIILSPEVHDRVISEISHLPHMVIFSMLNSIDKKSLVFASTGLYDATRIASSDAKIWRDIAVSNKIEILKSISRFKKNLSILEKGIKREDGAALLKAFKNAKNMRELL